MASAAEPLTGPRQAAPASEWRNTILAGLANYIDAGSIVAGSAALALWAATYHLSAAFLGLIGAFSANAISAGVGALIGGRLCDRLGRKTIYQFDMLFYAFGMLWLVFAVRPAMIVIGFILVGLSVGADIPASWSLIAELAPTGARARHSGMAQVLWYLGPTVVLLLSLALTGLGALGARLVFAHLAIVAVVLTVMRSRMQESARWLQARAELTAGSPGSGAALGATWRSQLRGLFTARHLRAMLFLIGMYGIWNLWAGTNGFFFPYILRTVGAQTQSASIAMQTGFFVISMVSIGGVFMRYADRVNQRWLFGLSALLQIAGMLLLATLPLSAPVALGYLSLVAIGGGFGAQSFFQLWSAELFPTLLRSTAQGVTFAVVRIGLGIWSFFVPLLTASGFARLAWILTGFQVVSGMIGLLWAPRHEGKSLEQIQAERESR